MTLFSVHNLFVVRNGKVLLDGVSFDVQQGEYLCIIGANGAGKSTLLKCLDKLLPFDGGDIFFSGKMLREYSQMMLAKRIAFVQQERPPVFAFTVRQLVEMGRYPHLSPLSPLSDTDKDVAEEAMRAMNILQFSHRTMDTLSGGEQQKVHIATALAQQADIIFLDEPMAFLDYHYQTEISALLRTLHRNAGKTIIEITHDVNRAASAASHVIALSEGRIVFDGTVDVLMNTQTLRTVFGINFQFLFREGVYGEKYAVPKENNEKIEKISEIPAQTS